MGYTAVFMKDKVLFTESANPQKVQFVGRRLGQMWVVDFSLKHRGNIPSALSVAEETNSTVLRLHEKYGHPNLPELKRMSMSSERRRPPSSSGPSGTKAL